MFNKMGETERRKRAQLWPPNKGIDNGAPFNILLDKNNNGDIVSTDRTIKCDSRTRGSRARWRGASGDGSVFSFGGGGAPSLDSFPSSGKISSGGGQESLLLVLEICMKNF